VGGKVGVIKTLAREREMRQKRRMGFIMVIKVN
jgi:hypothetical protein